MIIRKKSVGCPLVQIAALILLAVFSWPATASSQTTGQDDDEAYYITLFDTLDERYPQQDTSTPALDWANRVVELTAMQQIPLLAMLDLGANMTNCEGRGDRGSCIDEAQRSRLAAQWPPLLRICPSSQPPLQRMSCFHAVYFELSDRAFRTHSLAEQYRLQIQGLAGPLNFAWLARARPVFVAGMAVRDFDEVKAEAIQLDALIMFADYVYLRGLIATAPLVEKVCKRIGSADMYCSFDLYPQYKKLAEMEITAQLMLGDYNGQCSSQLCQVLEHARGMRVQTRLPSVSATSSAPLDRPTRAPPDAGQGSIPAAPAPTGPEPASPAPASPADYRRTNKASAARLGSPRIWVANGKPIFLPQLSPSSEGEGEPEESATRDPAPPINVVVDLGTKSQPLSPGVAGVVTHPSPAVTGHSNRPAPRTFTEWDWLENILRTVDRLRGMEDSKLTRYMGRFNTARTMFDLGVAMATDDEVRKNASAVSLVAGFVGGPPALLAIEMTGFDDALVKWQDSGGDVDQLMRWGADTARHVLSPFSIGRPIPYSQIYVGSGATEPVTQAQAEAYRRRARQAEEDRRYAGPCSVGALKLGPKCIRF